MRNASDRSCRGTQKTRLVFSNIFLLHRAVDKWKSIQKRVRATDDNMTHAHCMLHT